MYPGSQCLCRTKISVEYIRDKYKGIEAGLCTILLITKDVENIPGTKALFITLSISPTGSTVKFTNRLAFHFSIRSILSPRTSLFPKTKIIFNNQ